MGSKQAVAEAEQEEVAAVVATSGAAGAASMRGGSGGGGGGGDEAIPQRFIIQTHVLRTLTLNGRPALPAALLANIGGLEENAPQVLQFFSSAFLSLSGQLLSPVPAPKGVSSAAAASPIAGGASASLDAATPISPAYAIGFTALLRSLHRSLPLLLTEPPDLAITTPDVALRGLLREPLASGRQPLLAFLAAARRVYAALLSEGAIIPPADDSTSGQASSSSSSPANETPLRYRLVVTREGDILIEWSLESTLGRSWRGGSGGGFGGGASPLPPLAVGLPVRVNGAVRLRPDAVTGAVKEVWVRSVAINGRELLPAQISKARQSGGGLSGDVARDVRTVVEAILPFTRR